MSSVTQTTYAIGWKYLSDLIRFTQDQRVFLLNSFVTETSYNCWVQLIQEKFPDASIKKQQQKQKTMYKCFYDTGCINDRPRYSVLLLEFTDPAALY